MPAEPYSAHHSIQQPYGHYYGRLVDFCEGDEGFVCVGSSGKTAKVSAMPSPEKPPLLTPKKDKVPVLLSFLPNETALVTDSEDGSDANETFHDAETMPGEAHASMPPSPLSPRRTCASGPNPSPTRALVARVIAPTAVTTAQPSRRSGRQHPAPSAPTAADRQYERYRARRQPGC